MKYVSTRGAAPVLDFADVLLTGLASDGGLYVPEEWPALPPGVGGGGGAGDPAGARPYAEVATDVLWPYVEGALGREELAAIVAEAYATFDHPDVCPLVEVEPRLHVMELFHGPTLAFKDVALQLVGRLFDRELSHRGRRATIVVATSGDTGSAAIAACVGRPNLDVVVLHPAGRVSDVQRRQMTTVDAPNVHNVAVEGTFDDCQDLVKALFAEPARRARLGLSAMNSINWARVAAQITYYVTAVAAVGRCEVAVPTGNFGNAFAGWIARHSGAPIEGLVIGTNVNDILARWVAGGALVADQVVPTLSPSMDIQVSSNHERLLFELLGRDGAATAELVTRFRQVGSAEVPRDRVFSAAAVSDDETVDEIRRFHERTGYLADPHTAVGIAAARKARRHPDLPLVALATAHPAKFPDAVERATGSRPALPEHLADLMGRPEHYEVLPADLGAVAAHVDACVTSG
ncbi:MAG TPA: threonine synthase [Acidimicrobiales bacterium]|nr:threonine synthase [Acidimicrobiales bacterium]